MKWIKASEIKSIHLQPRCCRKIGRDQYWFTAHYDNSVDSYIQNIDGVQRNRIPIEKIEYLDESEQPSTDEWVEQLRKLIDEELSKLDYDGENWDMIYVQSEKKELLESIKEKLPPLPNKEG
jgi:hypothetical protein